MLRGLAVAALSFFVAMSFPVVATADSTGPWSMVDFGSAIDIQSDGIIDVTETIKVDFESDHHGIFRYIPEQLPYNTNFNRTYSIFVASVKRNGSPEPYSESDKNGYRLVQIGDANVLLSGGQTYVIEYLVTGALDAQGNQDGLAWHVKGDQWDVPAGRVHATVTLPSGSIQSVTCLQGNDSANSQCTATSQGPTASFSSNGSVAAGDDMRLFAAFPSGIVPVAAPQLSRTVVGYFQPTVGSLLAALITLVAVLGLVGFAYLKRGRDLVYRSVYYASPAPADAATEVEPLGRHEPLVVEFGAPDNLRPAELGLILDELPDTKDVTATIIDFASRGFLKIAQAGSDDWTLIRNPEAATVSLSPWEQVIYGGLFTGRDEVTLSALKGTFRATLMNAEDMLLKDGMSHGWFTGNPRLAVTLWRLLAILVVAAGAMVTWILGATLGYGLVGVAVGLGGIALFVVAGRMPRRSAEGSRILHKTLGFRLFMNTAEKYRQQFAEKQTIFTDLLPYAIVFGCCDRWASAFKDLATQPPDWYTGQGLATFNAMAFSAHLQSFNTSLAYNVTWTPPSNTGASGFSGGFGGGGGGGGGGAW